jgi:hypothetical protein
LESWHVWQRATSTGRTEDSKNSIRAASSADGFAGSAARPIDDARSIVDARIA